MIRVLFFIILLVYYWYFYASSFKPVIKPATKLPSIAPLYKCEFKSNQSDQFQFIVNGNIVWEHTLPPDSFTFYQEKIVQVDPCHGSLDNDLVPATGKNLYDYLKANPEVKNFSKFKENSGFTLHKGNVFYFKCLNGHIEQLQICPSGTTFVSNICQNVNSCSGKEDGTLFPHPEYVSQYIICFDETENNMNCPKGEMFYHDRCESIMDLTHYCKVFPNVPFIYDQETRVECQNDKLSFVICKPGMKFINSDECEPADCFGLPDDTLLPLPERNVDSFKFIPGYMMCRNNAIDKIVECPQYWNETLTKGDNLTFLPMVFDGQKCSIPTFCENVFSDDPDIIVPNHEFTKHVKNWNLSEFLDRNVGYICVNNVRKRKLLDPGKIISKRFKVESACTPNMPSKLPIYNSPSAFYDCTFNGIIGCPRLTYFDGSMCAPEPVNAFNYKNIPLFQFDSLNFESWIKPWDYSKDPPTLCSDPESTYIELYNICSHPDCLDFAFVSQIPDLAILLPQEQKSKCKFYESEKKLKKEPVKFEYHFWTQRLITDREGKEESCQPGQKLQTGNFIWDSTIFSTCNLKQPFVFCPSTHSRKIIQVSDEYFACEPPNNVSYVFKEADWTHFETNEIKRILPVVSDDTYKYIRINKSKSKEIIPEEGLDILENEKINLFTSQPVLIEPRFRVTHPPNVVFQYDEKKHVHTSAPDRGFLVKLKNFTHKHLSFPKYTPISFVNSLDKQLYV